jgi:hypothetical protein
VVETTTQFLGTETNMKLLNIDQNAKTVKGQKKGYMTGVMYMAPANLSGYEVCPMRSKGCTAACLNTAGRGKFDNIQQSRINKTKFFFTNRPEFMDQLVKEISALVNKAEKAGFIPCVRLNGTSDIVWESVPINEPDGSHFENLMALFPDVQFYDYTKRHNRKNLPSNYHLTYSLAEDNDQRAQLALANGMNVAAVFADRHYPKQYLGVRVVDGDESDLRFLDPKGVVVGLYAKGKAKKDTTGFVRPTH